MCERVCALGRKIANYFFPILDIFLVILATLPSSVTTNLSSVKTFIKPYRKKLYIYIYIYIIYIYMKKDFGGNVFTINFS